MEKDKTYSKKNTFVATSELSHKAEYKFFNSYKEVKKRELNRIESLAQDLAKRSAIKQLNDMVYDHKKQEQNGASNFVEIGHKSNQSISTQIDFNFKNHSIFYNNTQKKVSFSETNHEHYNKEDRDHLKQPSLSTKHNKNASSIEIKKSFRVFGENFISSQPSSSLSKEDFTKIFSQQPTQKVDIKECLEKDFEEDSKEKKKFIPFTSIGHILKLQEFIQSIYNIIKENKNTYTLISNLDSITEQWLELLNEVVSSIKDNFSLIEIVNLRKYFIYQQSFNVILFQCPIEANEKFINSLLLSINMFEQNNFLLLGFICGTYPFQEQTEIYENNFFLLECLNKSDLFNGNISKNNKEAIQQFNMNLQQISFLIKNFIKESSQTYKIASNFKESYNTNLIHNYISNLNNIGFSDTKKKLEKIFKDRYAKMNENKEKSFYLPLKISPHKFTLVLDLDETLIHYVEEQNNAFIQIRPYAEEFIELLSNHFELVIFTAAMKDYADFVLDRFDVNNVISYRLYRESTQIQDGVNIKNLFKIGRDIKTTIIIDNVEANFKLNPDNGYNIKNFEGEEDDEELIHLQKELIALIETNPDDVREYMHILKANMENRTSS